MKLADILKGRTTDGNRQLSKPILTAGAVSLVAYLLVQFPPSDGDLPYTAEMIEAATIMEQATIATREYCDSTGIAIDEDVDPNRTCLIGPELTPLMTTLGHLDAKRTTTDPAMASLVVHLLEQAGVNEGDTIAVGSSASFPALLIASLAAAEAMRVHPVVIISLGASTFGATNPRFNLLDIYTLLLRSGVLETPPAAISLGGDEDVGAEFDDSLKSDLLAQIATSGIRLISEPDLRRNVAARMDVYDGRNAPDRIITFVNTGGSYANLGPSQLALKLQPGLNNDVSLPPVEQRGILFEMAARGKPVIHLLFIRGLALRHGLTWDPIPLSKPGEVEIQADRPGGATALWFIGVTYLLAVTILLAAHVRNANRKSRPAG